VTLAGALGTILAIGIAPRPGEGAQPALVAALESIESLEPKPAAANGGATEVKPESAPSSSRTRASFERVEPVQTPSPIATRGSLESIETNRLGDRIAVRIRCEAREPKSSAAPHISATKGHSSRSGDEKLDTIVLTQFELGTITLGEAATALFDLVRKHDPKKTGFPIHVGTLFHRRQRWRNGIGRFSSAGVRSTSPCHLLKQITLRQALDALCESASVVWTPLHGALITERTIGPVEARQYVLDPIRLEVALVPFRSPGETNITYREMLSYLLPTDSTSPEAGPRIRQLPGRLEPPFSSLTNASKQNLVDGWNRSPITRKSTPSRFVPRVRRWITSVKSFTVDPAEESARSGTNKLDAIILPFLSIPEGPLEDVATKLQSMIRDADPEKRAGRVSVAAKGLKIGQTLNMGSGPLPQMLEMVTDNCTTPVEWALNGDEIVFRTIASGKWPLRTRRFHVDPPTFLALIRSRRERRATSPPTPTSRPRCAPFAPNKEW
jgi:hypothetical protein